MDCWNYKLSLFIIKILNEFIFFEDFFIYLWFTYVYIFMKKILFALILLISNTLFCQNEYYQTAENKIISMLEGKQKLNFKRAIFVVENAYHNDTLDYELFKIKIKIINTFKYFKQIEKDRTGTMIGFDIESQWDDYGYNISYTSPNKYPKRLNPQLQSKLTSYDQNAYAGYGIFRAHGLGIGKDGIMLNINMEENWGASLLIGGTVKLAIKNQGYWEF